jgi:olefin beta-lactone synthetase
MHSMLTNNDANPSVIEVLGRVAVEHADKPAIIDKTAAISFGELELAVRKTARHLMAKGIKKRDRVLLLVPFSIDLYRVSLALNYIGATAIFIEDWITFQQINDCCEAARPTAFISNIKGLIYSYLKKSLRNIPIKISCNGHQKYAPMEGMPALDLTDDAIISFTSGTSGKPKMLARDFHFLNHQFYTLREVKQCEINDIELVTLPAFVFINLAMGSTSVLANFNKLKPEKIDLNRIGKQLQNNQVNAICASPSFLLKLCDTSISPQFKSQISKITTGGSPVFLDDAKRLKAAFPNARTTIIYGSSEAEPIAVADGLALSKMENGAGIGLYVGEIHPETQVKIQPLYGNARPSAGINIGEILVSGPNVLMKGDGNKLVVDGVKWHRTGDSGCLNDTGSLFLTGPVASIVDFNGKYWSPFVFEGLSKNIAGVERATIVKVNRELIAAVVATEGADKPSIKIALSQLAFPFQQVVFVDKFPTDQRHGGKIKYEELERLIQFKMLVRE